ncbi:MAG: hypothetical protein ABJQ71_13985 [Roseibium sp.]|uniref:hypothetical protein n=1 Tax=Roseibium polysiphoniae TaxID=2571221 RepID=UPI003298599E
MSDIGGIFSPLDLATMLLVAASPGLAIGALAGAYLAPRRLSGALVGAAIGFVLCAAGWVIYLTALK